MSKVAAVFWLIVIAVFVIFWLKAIVEYDHPIPNDDNDWP